MKGKYKATDIEAVNISGRDEEGNLYFTLTFQGIDEKAGILLDVTVSFQADPNNYKIKFDEEGHPVFHKGRDFDASIEIGELPESE